MKTFKDANDKIIGTIVLPGEKTTCPYCFERFHVGDCRVIATKEHRDNQGNVLVSPNQVLKEVPTGIWRFFKYWIKPLLGRGDNINAGARRECPNCKRALPLSIEFLADKTIAIVGQSTAGKSHYTTSLIKELQSQSLRFVAGDGSRCTGLDQSVDEKFEVDYKKKVFDRNEMLDVTVRGNRPEPLIFTVFLKQSKSRFNLMFYDVSGEDIRNEDTRNQLCQYIMNASAMIYLVDPMLCEKIPSHLPERLRRPISQSTLPEHLFMNAIVQSILHYQGKDNSAQITIPTVITFSKSDLLEYLSLKNENGDAIVGSHSIFLREPNYRPGLQKADMEGVSAEVEALFEEVDPQLHQASRGSFKNIRYAAVSATGCPVDKSDPKQPKFPFIKPTRCLDPLFWCLHSLGMIEAK